MQTCVQMQWICAYGILNRAGRGQGLEIAALHLNPEARTQRWRCWLGTGQIVRMHVGAGQKFRTRFRWDVSSLQTRSTHGRICMQ
jgi:hypothetical protein